MVAGNNSEGPVMAQARFTRYNLGQQKRGAAAVVTLRGNAANVLLLDASNFNSYRAGRSYRYADGGLVTRSPIRLAIPRDGHWYVTVDLRGQGPRARVNSSISLEPPPLPIARSAAPASLQQIEVNRPPESGLSDGQTWDVFISHASEDKASVARPLFESLKDLGVSVWFDEAELRIGDSLRRKIDQGLAHSAFGVVIVSEAFVAKGWPQYELDGIVTRSVAGEQNLLPIWHKISRDEVRAQSPSLADKVARSTAELGIAEIAEEIARRVRPDLFG